MKYFLILLLIITIFIISVTLGSSNNQIITFNYLIAKGNYPISTLLAIIFTIGFILGWLICGILYAKALISLLNIKRKIKYLENQLVKLSQIDNNTKVGTITNKKDNILY